MAMFTRWLCNYWTKLNDPDFGRTCELIAGTVDLCNYSVNFSTDKSVKNEGKIAWLNYTKVFQYTINVKFNNFEWSVNKTILGDLQGRFFIFVHWMTK